MAGIRKPNQQKLQNQCDEFNEKYPVGTEVLLKKDFVDEPVKTKVKHEAYVLSGHSAVAFFEGISGSYLITCVKGLAPIALAPRKFVRVTEPGMSVGGAFKWRGEVIDGKVKLKPGFNHFHFTDMQAVESYRAVAGTLARVCDIQEITEAEYLA